MAKDKTTSNDTTTPSRILNRVMDRFKDREQKGLVDYGKTMDRNDLSLLEWVQNLQEELMDAVLYIEKLKQEIHYQEYELSSMEATLLYDEEWVDARMGIIGRNGNTGEHYETQDKPRDSVEVAVDSSQPCGWDNTGVSYDSSRDVATTTTTRRVYPGDAWITTYTYENKETK